MHKGIRPSRRDDIESCLYVLLNLSSHLFPTTKNMSGLTTREKNNCHYNYKCSLSTTASNNEFVNNNISCIKYAHNLNYTDAPNYGFLKTKLAKTYYKDT